MLFGYFALFVALIISSVAAYYSIVGLTAIFSAAVIPILIMGASLEVGKVTAAVWLKLNWHRASLTYKIYLVPAVAMLMLITSMGIFGFLSKAHNDQTLVSGDVQAKIAIYDEKIATEKGNIDADRKALKQLDDAVDQVMGRSSDEKGADKAVAVRKAQQKERARLQQEIAESQQRIAALNEQRAPIATEVRKVEAEVGPIKYIAALVYGSNPDANILERAVTWVIIVIVAVFDPLALVLILAAQQSIRWAREERETEAEPTIAELDTFVGEKPTVEELEEVNAPEPIELTQEEIDKLDPGIKEPEPVITKVRFGFQDHLIPEPPKPAEPKIADQHPYLNKPFKHFENLTPIVQEPAIEQVDEDRAAMSISAEPIEGVVERAFTEEELAALTAPAPEPVPEAPPVPFRREAAPGVNRHVMHSHLVKPDNVVELGKASHIGFGNEFPVNPDKGDVFLRTDYLPNRQFKFNGQKWIETDKAQSDVLAYDEAYIKHLIDEIGGGRYDADLLTDVEKEQIKHYLEK